MNNMINTLISHFLEKPNGKLHKLIWWSDESDGDEGFYVVKRANKFIVHEFKEFAYDNVLMVISDIAAMREALCHLGYFDFMEIRSRKNKTLEAANVE